MSNRDITPKAVTIRGASERAGIGRSTVYTLIGEGVFDARKSGRLTLVMVESIDRYLEGLPKAAIRASGKAKEPVQPAA